MAEDASQEVLSVYNLRCRFFNIPDGFSLQGSIALELMLLACIATS